MIQYLWKQDRSVNHPADMCMGLSVEHAEDSAQQFFTECGLMVSVRHVRLVGASGGGHEDRLQLWYLNGRVAIE